PQNFVVVSPQYGTVNLVDSSSSSTYHSLQAHVTKRTSAGLTGQLSYTFSKALGDGGTVRDARNLAASKGVLSVDRSHVIASSLTSCLPLCAYFLLFKSGPGFVQRIIEGWQLSSITSWQSGAPLAFNATGLGTLYNSATNTVDQVAAVPKGSIAKGNGF